MDIGRLIYIAIGASRVGIAKGRVVRPNVVPSVTLRIASGIATATIGFIAQTEVGTGRTTVMISLIVFQNNGRVVVRTSELDFDIAQEGVFNIQSHEQNVIWASDGRIWHKVGEGHRRAVGGTVGRAVVAVGQEDGIGHCQSGALLAGDGVN